MAAPTAPLNPGSSPTNGGTPKPASQRIGVNTKPKIHPIQSVTNKFPQSKTNAIMPWAAASLLAIVLGDIFVRGTNPSAFNPKQYIGLAFVFLVILLLPEEIGAVFAPLVFVGMLIAHHEFLTNAFKK